MKTNSLNLNLRIAGLALLLGQSASYAMPGMDMPSGASAQPIFVTSTDNYSLIQ